MVRKPSFSSGTEGSGTPLLSYRPRSVYSARAVSPGSARPPPGHPARPEPEEVLPMSARSARTVLVAGVVAGLVAVPAGAALADPPGIDPPSCQQTLLKVNLWPGTIQTAHGTVTLFSDGYDSHLAR